MVGKSYTVALVARVGLAIWFRIGRPPMRRLPFVIIFLASVLTTTSTVTRADDTPNFLVIVNDVGDNLANWANQVCNAPPVLAECGKEFAATRMLLSQAVLGVTAAQLAGILDYYPEQKAQYKKAFGYLVEAGESIEGLKVKYNKTQLPAKDGPHLKKP